MDLDHVVIVVTDLGRAVADYTALGFSVTPGGEHADGRTHNALIPFADGSYLELIAFMPDVTAPDHPWWRFGTAGGALADWALRTDTLDDRIAALRAAGLPLGDVRDGGRRRLDGEVLRWRTTAPAPERGLPFLIEDITPRALRVPSGAATLHSNGVRSVAVLAVAVETLEEAVPLYTRLLGAEASAPAPDPLLASTAVSLPCGSARVTLASAPAGPIHDRVRRLGPGPYALLLQTDGAQTGWLDETLSHGAPLRLQAG